MRTNNHIKTNNQTSQRVNQRANIRSIIAIALAILLALQIAATPLASTNLAFADEVTNQVESTTPTAEEASAPEPATEEDAAASEDSAVAQEEPASTSIQSTDLVVEEADLLTAATVETVEDATAAPISSQSVPVPNADRTEIDWFADVYTGLNTGHVFESVTWERLNYILGYGPFASNNTAPQDQVNYPYPGGNFAIVFGGPENISSQATLQYIDEVAKSKGVQKVYHFDPKLDGALDGDADGNIGDALDISNPGLGSANFKDMWTNSYGYGTKDRLGADFPTDYNSAYTYLFVYNKSNLVSSSAHPLVAQSLSKATGPLTADEAVAYKAEVASVFDAAGIVDGKANINTYRHIDYYQARINNVAATKNAGTTIPDSAKDTFVVQTVTYPELIHIFKSQGDFSILLGGTWCPYTCPTINTANTAAIAAGVNKIYQFDLRLDGASGNRHIRDNNATNSGGFSYLYGDLVYDYLTNLQLEPADNGALSLPVMYYPHNDKTKDARSQQRIGVPLHFEYNKDNLDELGNPAPVVSEWIGYAPFKDKLFAYAWFTANSLKHYLAKPDIAITGTPGATGTHNKNNGTEVTALNRHPDADFDNVISESTLEDGIWSASFGVPGLHDFFSLVAKNRTPVYDPWSAKPTGAAVDNSGPSETGGCGTGENPIDTTVETTILGQNGQTNYDVLNYDIQINYAEPVGATAGGYRAKTTISAKALADLASISLDLADLDVRKVEVDGSNATFSKYNDSATDTHKLIITPASPISEQIDFDVTVYYYAFTDSYEFGAGTTQGFIPSSNSNGATSIGEPNGPLYWFPSNNSLTDRATYDVRLTAPHTLVGVSAGVLVDRTEHGTVVTSHWQQSSPTLPYLEFVSFGNYHEFYQEIELTDGTIIPSWSYIDKTLYELSAISKANAYAFAENLQSYVSWAESKFGKYPGNTVGFVFENLENVTYNLETVGRPVYAGIPDTGVFVHELLHQWFGDSVTIADWKDLWLNEGLAVYLTNVYYEESGASSTPTATLYSDWFALQNSDLFWGLAPADPKNSYNLFGNGTYGRGSYALAALRNQIGDTDFFALLNEWATRYAGASVTTADFTALAEEITGTDLDAFFDTWLYATAKPASFPTPKSTDPINPFSPAAATGDYIADNYTDVDSGHVFESVTQERLLDILSSEGNYYIVFGGPSQATTQKVLSAINAQAKTDGVTKIYHFDPLIDGYQADITKSDTPYKVNGSIHALWTRITDLLPADATVTGYDSTDTLLFLYNRNATTPGTHGTIQAAYSFKTADITGFNADAEKTKIAKVFRANGSAVVPASVRTDLQFFNRVYNAAASLIEGTNPSPNRIGAPVTLFSNLTEANFKLHQINFAELQNLYATDGEHIIFYGSTWCHNTQAIIGTVALEAAKNNSLTTVYVYDTTLGNQIAYGTGADINKASSSSAALNSRNSASATPTANYNASYIYAESVRPLGQFVTENNSYKSNQIAYYPNGDLSAGVTTVKPYEATATDNPNTVSAIRLQLPFLVAFNKDATTDNKAIRQWLHQQAAPGLYLEYMLELAWVRATDLAKADSSVYQNGAKSDTNQTKVQVAAEAVERVKYVLQTESFKATQFFSGQARQDTAAQIALEAYPNGAKGVIIANGEGQGRTGKFPDALAATSLAGLLDYPILLTTQNSLPDYTVKALDTIAAGSTKLEQVIILGDKNTISDSQKTTLTNKYAPVERLSGTNRKETAVAIYNYGKDKNGGWAKTAIFADAGNFPDALAISPYAANKRIPIFLADGDALDKSVTAVFTAANFTDAIIVGSNKSVSDKIAAQIRGIIGKDATRLYGTNRYETASKIAAFSVQEGLSLNNTGIATGENFPDALTGGPLLAKRGSVLLLATDSDTSTLNLLKGKAEVLKLHVLGGDGSVSLKVRTAAANNLGWDVSKVNK